MNTTEKPMVDKAVFDAHIEQWMQDGARQIFFTQERYNWILSFLQGDEEVSARLTPAEKQYARRFNIQRVPTDVAFREVLYMDKKVKNKGDFNTEVVTYDRIHAILVSGRESVWEVASGLYWHAGLPIRGF